MFELLDMTVRAKKCDAMEGLVKEVQALLKNYQKELSFVMRD